MEFKNVRKFIKQEDQRLRRSFGGYKDEEKRILARTVKLGEEFGELCDEVLHFHFMQRQDKRAIHDADNLSHEFADVIITTFLLAEVMGVDIEDALEKKIEKIKERYKK